jgi:hypothetical protein
LLGQGEARDARAERVRAVTERLYAANEPAPPGRPGEPGAARIEADTLDSIDKALQELK